MQSKGQKWHRLLWVKAHEMGWFKVGKCAVVLWDHIFGKLLTLSPKKGPEGFLLPQVQEPASAIVWVFIVSAHGMGNSHICLGTNNAERDSRCRFWSNTCFHPSIFFFRYAPSCFFQQDNAKPHSSQVKIVWFWRKKKLGETIEWPIRNTELSPIQNVWHIIKWKIRNEKKKICKSSYSVLQNVPTPLDLGFLLTIIPRKKNVSIAGHCQENQKAWPEGAD